MSGTVATDRSGHLFNMVYGSGITLGSVGLMPLVSSDRAITTPANNVKSISNAVTSSGSVASLQASSSLAIEFWFRPNAIIAGQKQGVVYYGSDAAGNAPYGVYLTGSSATNAQFGFQIAIAGVNHSFVAGPSLVVGQIYHVVATYDGSTMKLYVNGSLQGATGASGALGSYGSSGLTFGNDAAFTDSNAQGVLDEVAIYTTTILDAPTVLLHYDVGAGLATPSPTPSPTATASPTASPVTTASPVPTATSIPTATPTATSIPTTAPTGLILYGSNVASGTLGTASMLSAALGGVETSSTTVVNGTNNYTEVWSLGNPGIASVSSIQATPSGSGWVYQPGVGTFSNGAWSVSANMALAAWAGTVGNSSFTIRFFKYSAGTYTLIGSIQNGTVSGIAKTDYLFPATVMPATAFGASDLLYVGLWYNDTTGAGLDNPVIYESNSSSAGVANDMQITTPTFSGSGGATPSPSPSPSPTTSPTTAPTSTASASSVVLYGSSSLSGSVTPTTASLFSKALGGTETSKTSIVSGASNFVEVWSQGSSSAASVTAIPSTPTGHGWVYGTGAVTYQSSAWSASANLSLTNWAGIAGGSSWTIRFFKHSGSTYTLIGNISNNTVSGTSKTNYLFNPTNMPSTTFGASDSLYVDLWYQDTTGSFSDDPVVYESTSAFLGVANDMQVTVGAASAPPGPTPTPTATALGGASLILGVVGNGGPALTTFNNWLGCNKQAVVGEYVNGGSSAQPTWASLNYIPSTITSYPAGTAFVWSLGTFPASTSLSGVAIGGNDAAEAATNYATWAQQIMAAPPAPDGNYYVRVNWEMPQSNYPWVAQGANNPAAYIGAFQNIATVFHQASPKFKMVWDVFEGATPGGGDDSKYYPGDSYVDVMSQDQYPDTNSDTAANQWNYSTTGANGLNWIATFAAQHNKPLAMSEWGVDSNNAEIMQDFFTWFAGHPYVYQLYWDIDAGGNFQGRIDNGQWPAAAAVFKSNVCSSATPAPTSPPTATPVPTVAPSTTPSPTPTPSPSPTATSTGASLVAPQLALNPNPFKVKACAADPCTASSNHPPFDGNSNAWMSAYFPSGLQWEHFQYLSPGANPGSSNGAAEDVVIGATSADPVHPCSGCADFSSINLINGAYSVNSAGDWQINVVNNTASGATPNYETDFWQFSSQATPITAGQAVSSSLTGGCFTNAFANGGNTCTMGTASYLPFSSFQLDPVELLQQNIPHMLNILNQCNSGFVPPAKGSDGHCGSGPPQGEILWLDWTDAQVEATSLPRWAKTLYKNMHDYGWMEADTSGDSLVRLQAVSDPSWTMIGKPSQWTLMYNEMRAEGTSVTNNGTFTDVVLPVPSGMTLSNLHWIKLTFSGGTWHF